MEHRPCSQTHTLAHSVYTGICTVIHTYCALHSQATCSVRCQFCQSSLLFRVKENQMWHNEMSFSQQVEKLLKQQDWVGAIQSVYLSLLNLHLFHLFKFQMADHEVVGRIQDIVHSVCSVYLIKSGFFGSKLILLRP